MSLNAHGPDQLRPVCRCLAELKHTSTICTTSCNKFLAVLWKDGPSDHCLDVTF